MEDLVPLQFLSRGERGQVGQLLGEMEHVHRLEEMGLRAGTQIEMIEPGCPCIIQIGGYRLCFRDNDVFHVLVRPGDGREHAV